MHFRRISAKIQPKTLKQHSIGRGPWPLPLATPLCRHYNDIDLDYIDFTKTKTQQPINNNNKNIFQDC